MDAKETLLKEISEFEALIRARRKALKALDQADASRGILDGRFTGKRPLAAIKILLAENGGKMSVKDLTDALIAGGLTKGKKRAHHNIRISLEISARAGSIVLNNGTVSLPAADAAGRSRAS